MKISVVSTLYQSAPYIVAFIDRTRAAVHGLTSDDYEILLVDDGSPDDALRTALAQRAKEPRLKVIELSRNFGHHKAMMTGLEHASGDLVFLIDVDLEEPPELLPTFHEKLCREELDVVYGFQQRRKGGLAERFSGWIAWKIIALLLPIRVPSNHSTVRLMTRDYVQALIRHKESKTAIGGLWVMTGFKQAGFPFRKTTRDATSYSFRARLFSLLDSITSFSETPLYFVFYLGIGVLFIAALIALWLLWRRFTGVVLSGWASTLVSVWFLGGLSVFSIGVVGLYISRIFIETKNRPYTIIRKIHGDSE
jgi:putative glycosyltransferase